MTNAELSQCVKRLIASISAFPDVTRRAPYEADRLIFRLNLKHPITLPAAMRIVSENTTLGELKLIVATADRLVNVLAEKKHLPTAPPLNPGSERMRTLPRHRRTA